MERLPRPRSDEEIREIIKKYQLDFPCRDNRFIRSVCPDIRCPNAFKCMTSVITLKMIEELEDEGASEDEIRHELFSDAKNQARRQLIDRLNLIMSTPYIKELTEDNEEN